MWKNESEHERGFDDYCLRDKERKNLEKREHINVQCSCLIDESYNG